MGWREDLAADGITYLNCGDAAVLDEAEEEARARGQRDTATSAKHEHEWLWNPQSNMTVIQAGPGRDGFPREYGFFICRSCPAAKWQQVEWRGGTFRMVEGDYA